MLNTLQVTFLKKKEIAQNTFAFYFDKPFDFVPGQYTTLFLGKENRDFTIASSIKEKNYFSIVTKKGISEFKKNLFALSLGSHIFITKPAGGFTLRSAKTPVAFLAGGIGITPFYSMIVSNKNITTPLTLLVSFSKKEDIIFSDELQKIQEKNPKIKIIYTLSRISETHIKKYVPDFLNSECMIAGGEKMVEDTEELLLKMKIPQEKIRIDIFTGY